MLSNRATAIRKVIIRATVVLLVICIVMAIWAYRKLCTGWDWSLPQEIIDKFDFCKLTNSVGAMIEDGFMDVNRENCAYEERGHNVIERYEQHPDHIIAMHMEWPMDCYPNAEISSEVSTALIHGNPRSPYEVNHDGYYFTHFIKIKKNKGLSRIYRKWKKISRLTISRS